jgi:hypothetical protein
MANWEIGLILGVVSGVVWILIWKTLAMWRAAKVGSKVWFVILLVVNTPGILDIIYLYVISKPPKSPQM